MKIIKCLAEKIDEELHDADAYIGLAMAWKDEEPETADLFYQLSLEEMGHVDRLHENVAGLISEYKKETGEPPQAMLTLYNYLHEKHIGEAMKIKVKQGIYSSETSEE